jgi:thiosulfate/3-mercaptopyruvate sulfurtransferase
MKKIISVLIFCAVVAMALSLPTNHIVNDTWLKAHIGDKNLVIVDLRNKGYNKGHIKGAVSWSGKAYREGRYYSKITKKPIPGYIAAPRTIIKTMRRSGVNNDSAIVFYNNGLKADDYSAAALAVATLEYYGFDNVALLDGGFAGWKQDNGTIDVMETNVQEGNFSFKGRKFDQNIIATGKDLDGAIWTGSYQIVDGNGKNTHWYGTAKDPRRLSQGHVRGAKALNPGEFTVKKDGVWYLGDKAYILSKMKAVGLVTTKPILWYCNTGWWASGGWFPVRYIVGMKDADVRIYNGSMADYTRWPNRPLIK